MPSDSPSRIARLTQRLATHTARTDDDPALVWAAVAIILAPDPDALLLIRRAERVGDPWSGHMAVPGGRRDPGDATLLDTAIRESAEEVGIELRSTQLIGALDDVAPRTPVLPPVAVRPYVFALPHRPPLVLSSEVASTHWVALDDLVRPEAYRPTHIELLGGSREFPAYHLERAVVWGMTERILTSLIPSLR